MCIIPSLDPLVTNKVVGAGWPKSLEGDLRLTAMLIAKLQFREIKPGNHRSSAVAATREFFLGFLP